MSYLNNYLELVEDLPQELRDQLMEMLGLDLSVERNMDSLESRTEILFAECERGGVTAQTDAEFQSIRRDYRSTLEYADEKVKLASQMCDVVNRNLRRLDAEIQRFKCDLEINHEGCTELIEKRSLQLDTPSSVRHSKTNHHQKSSKMSDQFSQDQEKASKPAKTVLTSQHVTAGTMLSTSAESAITAATSEAKPASRKVLKGKKPGNKKASKKATSTGFLVNEFNMEQELEVAAQTAVKSSQNSPTNKKKKRRSSTATSSTATSTQSTVPTAEVQVQDPVAPLVQNLQAENLQAENLQVKNPQVENPPPAEERSNESWVAEPDEPRYCLCNDVSYEDMIACDNPSCEKEWFHYKCVGIIIPPEGDWYCPKCSQSAQPGEKNN